MAVLIKAGMAHSWSFIALNALLLGVGLIATYEVLIRNFYEANEAHAPTICVLFLLSFVVIKHFTIPLTDIAFFCVAMSCLAVMSRAAEITSDRRFLRYAAAVWLLALAAVAIRRIGVALLPAAVFMIVIRPRLRSFLLVRRNQFTLALIFAVLGIGTTVVIAKTSTLSDFTWPLNRQAVVGLVATNVSYRLTEFGELFVNAPISKLPTSLHNLVLLIGGVPVGLLVWGVVLRRKVFGPSELFLIGYAAILLVWPYRDSRFWLPVIPLLMAYSAVSLRSFRVPGILVRLYCIGFGVLGIAAIVYSTQISFAGPKFAERYGDGTLRTTYCAAFRSCGDAIDQKAVDAQVLQLVQQYN
ncbi:MAG: hypothetical protein JO099_04190 [Acidobacteriia bacterium]|nr:hypothetical protein [Terriglobia bacterium]